MNTPGVRRALSFPAFGRGPGRVLIRDTNSIAWLTGERNGIWLSYLCYQTLRKKKFYEEKFFHFENFEKKYCFQTHLKYYFEP